VYLARGPTVGVFLRHDNEVEEILAVVALNKILGFVSLVKTERCGGKIGLRAELKILLFKHSSIRLVKFLPLSVIILPNPSSVLGGGEGGVGGRGGGGGGGGGGGRGSCLRHLLGSTLKREDG